MPRGASFRATLRKGVTILDDFERANPVAAYAGDTAEFAEETTTVKHGSTAIVSDPSTSGPFSIADTGVTTQQGETYRANVQVASGDVGFGWFLFTQSEAREPNGYLINLNDGRVSLFVNNNGYTKLAQDTNFVRQTGMWYDVEADIIDSGDWTVTVFKDSGTQAAHFTTTDNTFTSGGLGWRNGGTGAKYYDYARIV